MKVIDMHCDTLYALEKARINNQNVSLLDNDFNISINKMLKSQYLLQTFAIFTNLKEDKKPVTHVNRLIDLFYQELNNNKDTITHILSYKDIKECIRNNKIGALLSLEEGAVVDSDLSYLRNYYRLGVRMITLTWNYENGIGHPNFTKGSGYNMYDDIHGLTDFGIEYVKECERLGIIIDVSHLSDAGFYDVLKYTSKPFVASHSNVRALCPHARNMSDDMIKELAKRNGVMGINFCAGFLNQKEDLGGKSYVKDMIKHILYIRNLVGIDYVGLGTDFDGIPQNLEIKDASYMELLYKGLKEAQLSEEEIEKVFYKNVLRVFKEVLNQ